MLTSERVIWTASDARQARQPHGALAVPLHCVANAAEAGGGVLGWGVFGSFEVTFSVQPLYDPGQPPAAVTLAFAGGKDDRDQVFRELTRLLRERPWLAQPVAAPAPAPAPAAAAKEALPEVDVSELRWAGEETAEEEEPELRWVGETTSSATSAEVTEEKARDPADAWYSW